MSVPTPEFQRHHKISRATVGQEVRREAHHVVTKLSQLIKADAEKSSGDHITFAEYLAALRWRGDFDSADGVRDSVGRLHLGGRVDGGEKSSDGITERQVDAAHRLRGARDALGAIAITLIRQCVVYDTSWRESAVMLGRISHNTAKEWTCTALRGLAAYYDQIDGVGRQGGTRVRSAQFETA